MSHNADLFAEHRRVLGAHIRAIRIDRRQTQVSLARGLGVCPRTVLRLENGQAWPSVVTLIVLADILCCSLSDLVGILDPPDERVGKVTPEESGEFEIDPLWGAYEGIDPEDLDER